MKPHRAWPDYAALPARCLCVLLAATAAPLAALAGGIIDPTLPPPGYDGNAAAATNKDAKAPDAASMPDSNRLQMILLQGARRTAIVGNRSLKVGDSFEFNGSTARVLSIGDNGLVLQQGSGNVTLNLVDDVAAVRRIESCPATAAGEARCRKQ